ncbi:hypothetical protein [Sphingobium cloacae]|uniref:hypothetical protein n=1 Tax=Sphingobium cloacae TaxID=120107 RepID=UPI0014723343|nr:hypothetical protein [Sphingobium cloacae]
MEIPDNEGTPASRKEAHANMRRDLGSVWTLVNQSAAREKGRNISPLTALAIALIGKHD